MITIKVRAVRDVPLALDGVNVRTRRAGEEFVAPAHVVAGQIALGNLERVDEPKAEPEAGAAAYEAKPAAYETAVRRPRRGRG